MQAGAGQGFREPSPAWGCQGPSPEVSASGNVCRMDLSPRVRAVCDLDVAEVREYAAGTSTTASRRTCPRRASAPGSPGWRRRGPTASGSRTRTTRPTCPRPRSRNGSPTPELELHRRNPILHLGELDLACYDKDYAPQEERDAARAEHLAAWPRVADAAIESLDQVSAPVARGAARRHTRTGGRAHRGTGRFRWAARPPWRPALAAHARLVAHIERAAADGDPDPALGGAALAALMSSAEAMPVDLGRLAEQADAERDRLHALLADGCARLEPGRPALDVARDLVRDHPDGAGVIDAARLWTERAIEFTRDHDLVPYHDGVCLVGPAPESRRWAMAMMSPGGARRAGRPIVVPHHAAGGILAAA